MATPDESTRIEPEKKTKKVEQPEGPDPAPPKPEDNPLRIEDPRLPGNEPH
jgi:hypothetical protein